MSIRKAHLAGFPQTPRCLSLHSLPSPQPTRPASRLEITAPAIGNRVAKNAPAEEEKPNIPWIFRSNSYTIAELSAGSHFARSSIPDIATRVDRTSRYVALRECRTPPTVALSPYRRAANCRRNGTRMGPILRNAEGTLTLSAPSIRGMHSADVCGGSCYSESPSAGFPRGNGMIVITDWPLHIGRFCVRYGFE